MLDMSLVLASSFRNWIRHIRKFRWGEPGIGCASIEFSDAEEAEMKSYYRALNPHSEVWGENRT
jgi:hypothetical protein